MAWLRMCSSSPMFRPCAARPKTSTGPRMLEHPRQPRAELVAEEAQPLDRLVVADAEPQRPPGPLVEGRERAAARRPRRPRPASTASRRRSSARRGRARCPAPARCRRARAAPPPPRGRPPSPRRATAARSARRCGSQTRSQVIGGPECSSTPSRRPGHDRARAARPSPPAARSPRSPARRARWPPRPRRRAGPTAASGRRASSASPPAGGRQSTSHDRRALIAQRVGEGREPEVDGVDSRQDVSSRRHAALAWFNGRDGRSRRAGRAVRPRPGCSASATSRSSSAWAPASTATTRRSSRTGTGSSSSAARRSRRRSCRRPVRRRRRRGRHERLRRARDGRAPARASSTCSSRPDKAHAEPVLDGIAWAVGHARRAGRRRPPDARPRARAVGLLHRLHDRAAAGVSGASPATSCSPRSRSTAGT